MPWGELLFIFLEFNVWQITKAVIHGISMFHLNVILFVIWKFIFHTTDTLRCRRVLSDLVIAFTSERSMSLKYLGFSSSRFLNKGVACEL